MLNQAGKHIACAAQANSKLGRAPGGEGGGGADEASPDGRIRLHGVVESEEFLGSRIRYTVKAGDATILVDASHQAGQSEHDVGAKVALYLTTDQLRVLRR